LLDATREAARLYSGGDPFDSTLFRSPYGSNTFYYDTAIMVRKLLDPSLSYANPADYKGRRIALDPAVDDVIVSVYGATGSTVTLRQVYHLLPTAGSVSGNYPSIFNATNIQNTRVSGAPNAGVLLVEVHYNYHQVLGLPWIKFIGNPVHLRAYTIMPLRSAEPP
jgi:hypothetical protein